MRTTNTFTAPKNFVAWFATWNCAALTNFGCTLSFVCLSLKLSVTMLSLIFGPLQHNFYISFPTRLFVLLLRLKLEIIMCCQLAITVMNFFLKFFLRQIRWIPKYMSHFMTANLPYWVLGICFKRKTHFKIVIVIELLHTSWSKFK